MLRAIWTALLLVLLTPSAAIVAIVLSFVDSSKKSPFLAAQFWARGLLSAVGAEVTYEGLEHRRAHMPCVFVANHQSNVDVWAVLPILPTETKFVAKHSLFRIPFLGLAMRRAGFISIDRTNRARAIQSLELAAARVRAGNSVILFPEGTRSADGRLQPFKKGAFHLALRAGVPIVPIVISGSGRVLPVGALRSKPGPVLLRLLPPIDVTPFVPDDHILLRELVHQRMAEALESSEADAATELTASSS